MGLNMDNLDESGQQDASQRSSKMPSGPNTAKNSDDNNGFVKNKSAFYH